MKTLWLDKASQIACFAFARDRGISKIEISTDGGKSWRSAITKEPLPITNGFYGPVDLPSKKTEIIKLLLERPTKRERSNHLM
jgi:hypothetical protein